MIPVPRVRAIGYIGEVPHARTFPGHFVCRGDNGQRHEYIVKFYSQLQSRLICEFVAGLLGHQLGLPIAPVAVVELPSQLASNIQATGNGSVADFGLGPHFGSEFQTGGQTPTPSNLSITEPMMPQAIDIFAFDMLIQNPDRSFHTNRGKPNFLTDGEAFLIYDHELAFSFLSLIGPIPNPCDLRAMDFPQYHVFYQHIRRYTANHSISFEGFLTRLSGISEQFLLDIVNDLPENWRNPTKTDRIVAHLLSVCETIDRFERGLLEVLA